MAKISNSILEAAINGFEAQKKAIDVQIAELRSMIGGGPARDDEQDASPERKRRRFSAAARQRMREAQRLRWARIRGGSPAGGAQPAAKSAGKGKRRLSAEGRKAISAAMKKRWAARKAAAAA